MATKHDLQDWVKQSLITLGGRGTLLEVARLIWANHEEDLKSSGDLFYTWQYDARWAATALREAGVMKSAEISPKGVWELK